MRNKTLGGRTFVFVKSWTISYNVGIYLETIRTYLRQQAARCDLRVAKHAWEIIRLSTCACAATTNRDSSFCLVDSIRARVLHGLRFRVPSCDSQIQNYGIFQRLTSDARPFHAIHNAGLSIF